MHVVRSISVADGMTLSACLPLPNNKTVLLGSKVCSNCWRRHFANRVVSI